MSEYVLRNLDPQLWSRFADRGNREGWPTKALFVALMKAYANGSISIGMPPPKQLPQYAWLRAHYRLAAKKDTFRTLDVNEKWSAIIDEFIDKLMRSQLRAALWPPLHLADDEEEAIRFESVPYYISPFRRVTESLTILTLCSAARLPRTPLSTPRNTLSSFIW